MASMAVAASCSWAQRWQNPELPSFPLRRQGRMRVQNVRVESWAAAASVWRRRPTASLAAAEVPQGGGAGEGEAAAKMDFSSLKAELLIRVGGLDRGLVASAADGDAVEEAARKLEDAGTPPHFPQQLDLLQGRWRLVYSSAFASGSVGGRRPGPPLSGLLLPFTLGQVYQRIDVPSRQCDNVVDVRIATPWPFPTLQLTATLAHTLELTGGAGIRIIFEKSIAKAGGGLSELPPLELPQLPDFLLPSPEMRSGRFDSTFVDEEMRISRGDRAELRVFVKA